MSVARTASFCYENNLIHPAQEARWLGRRDTTAHAQRAQNRIETSESPPFEFPATNHVSRERTSQCDWLRRYDSLS